MSQTADPHSQSQNNLESASVVRRYLRAWVAGDAMEVVALYHPDLTLIWPGRHRFAGTYEGQQASIEALLSLQAATNRVPVEIVDVLVGEHGVIAVVRERWSRGEGDSPTECIELTRALDFTVIDAKLRTCRIFEFDQAAIDDWLQGDNSSPATSA